MGNVLCLDVETTTKNKGNPFTKDKEYKYNGDV